jgi:hypothetical protein
MLCGRCCVTEPPTKLALRLDIFIEILPRTSVNKAYRRGRTGALWAPVLCALAVQSPTRLAVPRGSKPAVTISEGLVWTNVN